MLKVEWYSIFMFTTVFDILVELKVFLGRFDARTLMKLSIKEGRVDIQEHNGKGEHSSPKFDASKYPTGSVFDCRPGSDHHEDVWFDFMADCGDGFDSSYQVARMLAQPRLPVKIKGETTRVLPRGSFLVIGGDLAYPQPDQEK